MLRCGICNGEVRPHGRTNDIHTGHPICNGPVCQFCYENKVIRARIRADPTPTSEKKSGESRAGMWLYIADDGREYSTTDPRDLIFGMVMLGDRDLSIPFKEWVSSASIPEYVDTPEEQLEALAGGFAQNYEVVPIQNFDYFNSIWIDFI